MGMRCGWFFDLLISRNLGGKEKRSKNKNGSFFFQRTAIR
jgi:hypothetical protein